MTSKLKEHAMADSIKLLSVMDAPGAPGDAATLEVRCGQSKRARILLSPGSSLAAMRDTDWRTELHELAKVLTETRMEPQ